MHRLSLPKIVVVLAACSALSHADTIDLPSRACLEQLQRVTSPEGQSLRVTPSQGVSRQAALRILNPRLEPSPAFLQTELERNSPDPAARFAEPIRLSLSGASPPLPAKK